VVAPDRAGDHLAGEPPPLERRHPPPRRAPAFPAASAEDSCGRVGAVAVADGCARRRVWRRPPTTRLSRAQEQSAIATATSPSLPPRSTRTSTTAAHPGQPPKQSSPRTSPLQRQPRADPATSPECQAPWSARQRHTVPPENTVDQKHY
jgi:hypothetical protein